MHEAQISDYEGQSSIPSRPNPLLGRYILEGKVTSWANVSLIGDTQSRTIETVAVIYHDFSDDGGIIVLG